MQVLAKRAGVPIACSRRFGVPSVTGPVTIRRVPVRAASADAQTMVTEAKPTDAPTPAPAKGKDDVQGDMLKPSVVNTSWVRTLAMVGAVVAAASSTAVLPARATAFMHVLAYGLWLGTNIWNTFYVGLTMFKHMPRQTFGRVQAQLFPKYFFLTTAANFIVLGSLLLGGQTQVAVTGTVVNLAVALLASLTNAVYIEPLASDLMFQRYEIENKEDKTEEDKTKIAALYKQFGKWHGISSLLNLITTCAALAHGWHLAGGVTLASV